MKLLWKGLCLLTIFWAAAEAQGKPKAYPTGGSYHYPAHHGHDAGYHHEYDTNDYPNTLDEHDDHEAPYHPGSHHYPGLHEYNDVSSGGHHYPHGMGDQSTHNQGSAQAIGDHDAPPVPVLGMPNLSSFAMQRECQKDIRRRKAGHSAMWKDASFQASLRNLSIDRWDSYGQGHYCSGSIISKNAILTAASCLKDRKTEDIGVVVGTLNRRKAFQAETQLLLVDNIIIHPGYLTEADSRYDIGIVVTSSRFKFGLMVTMVEMPTKDPLIGTRCKTFGWGITGRFGHNYTDCLQKATLSVADKRDCERQGGGYHHSKHSDLTICAGNFVDSDPCTVDVGSPLICKGKLKGIVNSKDNCGGNEHLDKHTSVFPHKGWIKRTLKKFHARSDDEATGSGIMTTPGISMAIGLIAFILETCIYM